MFSLRFSFTNRFSETCFLDKDGLPTCDACLEGYTGRRCERYRGFKILLLDYFGSENKERISIFCAKFLSYCFI